MALNDINQMFSIVDPDTGKPTDYLMRLLRDRGIEVTTVEEAVQALNDDLTLLDQLKADKSIVVNSGFGLSGGGDLSANRTISLGNPALADPNADRGLFWDDSAGQLDWLEFGSGLTVTGKVLSASGGGGGGQWTLVSSTTISSPTASVPFTGLGAYTDLLVICRNLTTNVSSFRLVRLSVDNGATYFGASGDYITLAANGTVANVTAALFPNTAAATAQTFGGVIYGVNVNGAPKFCQPLEPNPGRLFVASTSPVNAIRVEGNGNNLTGGTIFLFGR